MSDEQTPIETMSFEAALAELEGIVQQLESGDVELEKSIAIYERGAALKAHCETKLREAELKVEKIVLDDNGRISTEDAGLA
ncbi:exodeoxyribonuclease VII small subunit [Hyphobacterium indicum]|uniref:exodeoxyribonuclease VII small subunit n=1 Tax=Hyphobacterium indicum TaxID=2162714 RepID=UPI000CB23606|nr:exodeoxyribonuclease VII small subunit [Hyphobacterium indicum]MBI1236631.1 exodeoxyribonuclease VII small subunit [Alphaproteobacteria bacterium]PIW29532.1 MAG: exodeoxyribonuclease VII small subunit [Rhodobacterales bacterium CG15_BIG_FIL_POST_REV_8_21_14_020_59_13]